MTKIEWCEESWNPITGCSPVSEGCEHCYARRMGQRLRGRYGYPKDDPFRVTFHPDRLDQPLKWQKPRTIFVCSMGDLFHDHVKIVWLVNVLNIIFRSGQHIFLMLTKRPEEMKEDFEWLAAEGFIHLNELPHLWLGVTAENQQRADERIPILLQIPAAKRFVSIEPMLGPVDVNPYFFSEWTLRGHNHPTQKTTGLNWVICGGESGPGARPMHPDWVRSVRDQCQSTGVPFFFKQWGEWSPHLKQFGGGIFLKPDGTKTCQGDYWDGQAAAMNRIGKKAAGRLLDGREWNEKP